MVSDETRVAAVFTSSDFIIINISPRIRRV